MGWRRAGLVMEKWGGAAAEGEKGLAERHRAAVREFRAQVRQVE